MATADSIQFPLLLNKGDGTFEQGAKYRVRGISSLATIDLNGDSNLDIVTINPKRVNPNTLFVFFNQGNGRFRKGESYALGYLPSSIKGRVILPFRDITRWVKSLVL